MNYLLKMEKPKLKKPKEKISECIVIFEVKTAKQRTNFVKFLRDYPSQINHLGLK